MGKNKKKRNKVYKGSDAASVQPSITRISAIKRNKVQQWWLDHKRVAKPVGITSGVLIFIVWMIFELFRVVF